MAKRHARLARVTGTVNALVVSMRRDPAPAMHALRRRLRENSLSLTFFVLFVLSLTGQVLSGWRVYRADALQHGGAAVALTTYVTSGHCLEATFENWESEFLQMMLFVALTARLLQKGSAESKPLHGPQPSDADPRLHRSDRAAPWPVKKGGVWLSLYERSLSIALGVLFLVSFGAHAVGGLREFSAQRIQHGEPPATLLDYVRSSQFWFESLQNWQSEFFAVLAVVVLSIVLRQRGSTQSKPVHAAHGETG